MNELQIFNFNGNEVRTITDENGDPWFVAIDVSKTLGYENPSKAILDHCKKANKISIPEIGYVIPINIIPESDVYRLVMRSRLIKAEEFQDWVVEEVLPQIRKTGQYSHSQTPALPSYSEALRQLADSLDKQEEQRKQIEAQQPKVDHFDKFMDSDGTLCLRDALKSVGLEPIKAGAVLKHKGYLTQKNIATQRSLNLGIFVVKTNVTESGFTYTQTRVTPKGIEFLGKHKDRIIEVINAMKGAL